MKIYLDNNATTSLDPRVREAMIRELHDTYGNPSSIHSFGRDVRNRLIRARRTIASYLMIKPQEIIFTSGGTESINHVVQRTPKGHIITSNVEHAALYSAIQFMEKRGLPVTYLEVGEKGSVTCEAIESAIRSDTCLIAIMAVNNETGVKTDIEPIAHLAGSRGIPLFIDAVSLLGKESFVIPSGVSAMAFSSHKIHGPSGIGALYIRSGTSLSPFLLGGGQEYNQRGGTENVLGTIGFAKAVEILQEELPSSSLRMADLRDALEKGLMAQLDEIQINGTNPRICNTTNLSFPGVDGESLLLNLDLAGIAVSHGSACSSGGLEPSRILLNMGIPKKIAATSIRFSLSRFTTKEEIESCIDRVVHIVRKLRALSH